MELPDTPSPSAARAFLRDREGCQFALAHLARVLNRPGRWTLFARGSCLVGGSDEEVLKVFAPVDTHHADVEAAALEALEGRLPVETPTLLERGLHRGWPYLRMRRLPGEEAAECFDDVSSKAQRELALGLGETLAELHALTPPPVIPRLDWTQFVDTQRRSAAARHRRKGCPEPWVEALEPWLEGVVLQDRPRAWLHTEVMLEHLLVSRDGGHWSGVFDFEPSWVAPLEYELASVGLFVSRGDGVLFRAVREGLGWAPDPERPRRCLAHALLHRYADLGWYLRRLGPPERVNLDALAEAWFGEAS